MRRQPVSRPAALRLRSMGRRGASVVAGLGVLLMLASALGSAFLTASSGASYAAAEDGLRDALGHAPPHQRSITLRLHHPDAFLPTDPTAAPGRGWPAPFDDISRIVRDRMSARLESLVEEETRSAQSDPMVVSGTGVTGRTVQAVVRLDTGVAQRVRWVAGTAPAAPTRQLSITTETTTADPTMVSHPVRVIPVGLRDRTARAWGVEVGDVLELDRTNRPEDAVTDSAAVVVAGLYAPKDADDPFWDIETRLLGVAKVPTPDGGAIDQGAVVGPMSSYGALTDSLGRRPAGLGTGDFPFLQHEWRYSLRADSVRRADLPAIDDLLGDLRVDTTLWPPQRHPEVATDLAGLADGYEASVQQSRVVASFATVGIAVLTMLVLGTLSVVLLGRRLGHLDLLDARGASRAQLGRMVAAWILVWSLPGLVVGTLAGLALTGGRLDAVTVGMVLLVGAAPVVVGLVSARGHLAARLATGDRTRGKVRRLVLDLGVVVLAVLAVTSVRARGADVSGGRQDWFVAAAPALVALAAGVVLLRLHRLPLAALAARLGRGRGLVGFLGLSRAAQAGRSAAVPVLAIVMSASLVALLASVATTVSEHRELTSYRSAGADARVDYTRLDDDVLGSLRERQGVSAAAAAMLAPATVTRGEDERAVTLVAVDPEEYAELLDGTPIAFDPPALHADGGLPVLVSDPDLGGDRLELEVAGRTAPAVVVGVVPALERVVDGRTSEVVLAPLQESLEAWPSLQPDTALLRADDEAARALERGLTDEARPLGALASDVVTASGAREQVGERPLARLVSQAYAVGLVLATILGLVSVLALLASTRSQRMALAVRLRAMGLPAAQAARIWAVEVFPLALLAGATGAVAGAVAPAVLAPALDLRPFTGAPERPPLADVPVSALVVAVAVVAVLTALALVLDARRSRRVPLAESLRQGETP